MKRTEYKTPFRYYDYGIDEWLENDNNDNLLNKLALNIGLIIIEFNSLEDAINWHIKEILSHSEGQDETVFLFLPKMHVNEKIDLLIRLYGQWVLRAYELIELRSELNLLETNLKDATKRRNRYVHTNWSEMYNDRLYKIKTEAKRDGVYHTFMKFDEQHLKNDLEFISTLQESLWNFDEKFNNKMNTSEDRVLIFSYGSNMYSKRIKNRTPSVNILGIGKLIGYRIEFSKKSKDGSGKATLVKTNNKDFVWGTIFSISKQEKQLLDEAEGLGHGYKEDHINVKTNTNEDVYPLTYVADESYIDNSLLPYDWYKRLVVEGAKENDLPLDYIKKLEMQKSKIDINEKRANQEMSIL